MRFLVVSIHREQLPAQYIMNNIIIYTTASEFYAGAYELTRLGVNFVGHFDDLKIELTGGY